MKLLSDLAATLPQLREADLPKFCALLDKYTAHLPSISSALYERLDAADQDRFVIWFLKRWGKIDVINRVESGLYQTKIQSVKQEPRTTVELNGTTYHLRDFASQGCAFQLLGYEWVLGVHDVYYNQYEHKDVTLSPGDVIIDAGAFIGDTAVLFSHKLGGQCEVHSFELLDENIALIQHNLERNGGQHGPARFVINKAALTDVSGGEIVIAPGKTAGATSIFGTNAGGEKVGTITLDDYVIQNNLTRVDFIKMDIEGAELAALKGARRTIQHFKPKLAICLYHKWDDAFTIPQFIHSIGVEYSFGFKWVQLSDGWEAVLLASPVRAESLNRVTTTVPTDESTALARAFLSIAKAYAKKHGQLETLCREKLQNGSHAPAPSAPAPVLATA